MIGERLGPYRIRAELGSGGMGTVFLADTVEPVADLARGTAVALKVVHEHLRRREGFSQRLAREAHIGRQIDHPNVVRTYDIQSIAHGIERVDVLVMEYVEGQTLRALLDRVACVPEALCRHIGTEVGKGLEAIHRAGAVHRDVKPENVLITKDEVVKLMDLGVARLADEALQLSQSGMFIGSALYAAPEQFSPEVGPLDGRADLYALGLTLYELATGRHPFGGGDLRSALQRQLTMAARPAAEVNPQLTPFFEDVLRTLLAKAPDGRFNAAWELARVLESGEEGPWWRRRASEIRAATHAPLRRVRIPRDTELCGREAELKQLAALWAKVKAGEGQVLLVEGEAGIGKSRLVDEFAGRLRQEGEELHYLFGSWPPGGAATAVAGPATAFREHLGETDLEAALAAHLAATPLLVPAFAALLKGDAVPRGVEPLAKDSLQTVFVQTMRSLARQRPLLLLVDDLHFAPEEGRALFAALAVAVQGHPVLLVGTSRPGLPVAWTAEIERLGRATRMSLARLGPKDLAKLLKEAFGSERLAEELAFRIGAKSDGNPFFAFEIIRALREGGLLERTADGTWGRTQEIHDLRIPSTVLDLVEARIRDLKPEERSLLEVAACSGFEFDPLLVGEVVGLGRIPVLQRLAEVEKSNRLVRSVGRRYVFDHHQVQEALYTGLSELLREEYHAAIAEAIERRDPAAAKDGATAGLLCEHFFAGGRAERALPYLQTALDHLERAYANDAAIGLIDRALAAPGLLVGRPRMDLLLRKAGRLDLLGRPGDERTVLDEAMRIAEAEGDVRARARVRATLGWNLHRSGRPEEARESLSEALVLAREIGDRNLEGAALGNLGIALATLGRPAEARERHERCLAIFRELGDRRGEALASGNVGNLLHTAGRHEEAREHHERARSLLHEIGDRRGEAVAIGNLGNCALALGRFAEAKEHHERHRSLSREIGYRPGEATALINLGPLLGWLGQVREAIETLETAIDLCRELRWRGGESFAVHALGTVAAQAGSSEEAERRLRVALSLRRAMGFRGALADTLLALGALLGAEGRVEEARTDLKEALLLAKENDSPGTLVLADVRLALLSGGRAETALAGFQELSHRLHVHERMEAAWLLGRATGRSDLVAQARGLLLDLIRHAPPGCREAMRHGVPLHAEIDAESPPSVD